MQLSCRRARAALPTPAPEGNPQGPLSAATGAAERDADGEPQGHGGEVQRFHRKNASSVRSTARARVPRCRCRTAQAELPMVTLRCASPAARSLPAGRPDLTTRQAPTIHHSRATRGQRRGPQRGLCGDTQGRPLHRCAQRHEGCQRRHRTTGNGCREGCVKKTRKRHAVREMKVDPSKSPCRRRLQTAMSCFGQKPRW